MGGNPRSYPIHLWLEVRDRGANQERNHTSTRSSTSAARQRTVWVARTRAAARRSARRLAREAAKAKAMAKWLQMGVRSVHKALGIYARCQLESHLNQLGHMRLNVWRHRWLRRFSPTFLFGFICAALGPRNQF